jgi:dienelactone hydrolase
MAANALVDDIAVGAAGLRRAGAQRIVLMGASRGGAEVVIAGAHPPDGVVGVVAVSADDLTDPLASPPYPASAASAAPLLALPSLFVVAANDPFVSVTATQAVVSSVPAGAKQLVVVPDSQEHGWDLFDPTAVRPSSSPNDEVVAFLAAALS